MNIATANITPAYTTTQLLLSNSKPYILSQRIIIDLTSIVLQSKKDTTNTLLTLNNIMINSSKNDYYDSSFLQNEKTYSLTATAAHQPKRPSWTYSYIYLRGSRTNCDNLRMLVTEQNMIRASKITRVLKPRSVYLPKRKDKFIWGKLSHLRQIV
ncbi:uncharacterized protein BX663DRAFT_526847 [Cokeromyces recurvatus]|uniref:uncharacterized protein n=1 Tax=Cokeromyces recurvatus TaxID=90255 RepID=UPI00221E56A0|nr:uncharacterized protein BX663DRAFT_526847 [Cokeromyces recurvatus]KAI7897899.1 hypothetical protein BX663DRAFT_526847 [Cokeromyces recurvatus]